VVNYPSGYATPPHIYRYSLVDAPGAVAANTFLSVFNPRSSPVLHRMLGLIVSVYAMGVTVSGSSLVMRRSTAQSGGTLVTASTVERYVSTDPDPAAVLRVDNPTVTASGLPLRGIPPAVAVGTDVSAGGTGSDLSQPPSPTVTSWVLRPNHGLVFATADGYVNQLWNIAYTWTEVPL